MTRSAGANARAQICAMPLSWLPTINGASERVYKSPPPRGFPPPSPTPAQLWRTPSSVRGVLTLVQPSIQRPTIATQTANSASSSNPERKGSERTIQKHQPVHPPGVLGGRTNSYQSIDGGGVPANLPTAIRTRRSPPAIGPHPELVLRRNPQESTIAGSHTGSTSIPPRVHPDT